MTAEDKPRKKRIFIASSQADVAKVQKAMQHFDLEAVTLEQAATPGTTWVDSLHRCVNDADLVIGIMGDRFSSSASRARSISRLSCSSRPTIRSTSFRRRAFRTCGWTYGTKTP